MLVDSKVGRREIVSFGWGRKARREGEISERKNEEKGREGERWLSSQMSTSFRMTSLSVYPFSINASRGTVDQTEEGFLGVFERRYRRRVSFQERERKEQRRGGVRKEDGGRVRLSTHQ